MIYFIVLGQYPYAKMGNAANVRRRLSQHQVSNPIQLWLLASVQGDAQTEFKLKRLFQGQFVSGEWFHLSPETERMIDAIVRANGEVDEFAEVMSEARIRKFRDRVAYSRNLCEQLCDAEARVVPAITRPKRLTVAPLSSIGMAA